jgi:hypothetical protein
MTQFLNSKQAQAEQAVVSEEQVKKLVLANATMLDRMAAMEETLTKAYLTMRDLQVENAALRRSLERCIQDDNAADGG